MELKNEKVSQVLISLPLYFAQQLLSIELGQIKHLDFEIKCWITTTQSLHSSAVVKNIEQKRYLISFQAFNLILYEKPSLSRINTISVIEIVLY